MRDDRETEDYEVGYKKPPKSGQFKKGVSGNPSGRPKRASDFEAKLLRELDSPLTINENGKKKVITKDEGIAKQVVNKALRGHVPSVRLVDEWRRQGLEKAAEQQRLANRPVRELTDEELTALILADHPELEKPTPDGADGR
jgi:Family of unknown function (DUF5681)